MPFHHEIAIRVLDLLTMAWTNGCGRSSLEQERSNVCVIIEFRCLQGGVSIFIARINVGPEVEKCCDLFSIIAVVSGCDQRRFTVFIQLIDVMALGNQPLAGCKIFEECRVR